ncbi:MAG: U32 family peptidase [Bacilli bacterium]|nr:U32 family peptidase [Bacilli bacterium]
MPELLAPAGDMERLKYALIYGADAVYIGGPLLGLRANAINFSFDEIKEACELAHSMNKKIYVTVNIVLHNKELKAVIDYLKKLEECNVDAIIVSDLTIVKLALEHTKIPVHISTQASSMNVETAKFYKELGCERIVLARECSKEEIKAIKDNVDIELECFIHGAMCAGISGRCALSNLFTGRDANRGGCAQICRWDFDLLSENKETIKGEKEFTFCAKDLSMLKYIPDMIDQGITSFKIEGRMRSIYYIATIVNTYRKVIDSYLSDKENYKYNPEYEKILRNCANRDSVPQFYNGVNDSTCGYYNGRVEVSNQDFLGVILDYDKESHLATVQERNLFKVGDKAIIFGPNHEDIEITIDEIYDMEGNTMDLVRHPMEIVKVRLNKEVFKYDLIRK